MAQSKEKFLAAQEAEKKARAAYRAPEEYLGADPDLYDFVRDEVNAHPELGKDYAILFFSASPDEDNQVRIAVQNYNILRDDIRIDVTPYVRKRKAEAKAKAKEATERAATPPDPDPNAIAPAAAGTAPSGLKSFLGIGGDTGKK